MTSHEALTYSNLYQVFVGLYGSVIAFPLNSARPVFRARMKPVVNHREAGKMLFCWLAGRHVSWGSRNLLPGHTI